MPIAALKKNIKISKEKIPAATQLFTPDWIVRYMVENSLGRLWVEGHPNDELKANWKYYLEEAPQEPEVEAQLKKIRAEYAQIDPASILCADPCMGSGHILVYMFDVLMQIYLAYGYTTNEAVESIVRNNLWGMDIDDRAAQLAYFAVMMKAQQYDHRWLAKQVRHPVQPNVFTLQDSGDWLTFERQMRQAFAHHPSLAEDTSIRTAKALFETFADAKEYGSIIQPEISLEELNMLENTLDEMAQKANLMDFVAQADAMTLMETLKPLIRQCRGLVQKYHAVVTNPPYMGGNNMNSLLSNYVKERFPNSNNDLFAVFIERILNALSPYGYEAMITQQVWMFTTRYEKIRRLLLLHPVVNMLHLGANAFSEINGEVVQTTSFVISKHEIHDFRGVYYRLTDPSSEIGKKDLFIKQRIKKDNRIVYESVQSDYETIPGIPYAYWASRSVINSFEKGTALGTISKSTKGIITGDNSKFMRFWWEIDVFRIHFSIESISQAIESKYKWFPCTKGGDYRKWYGNKEYIMDWENDGYHILKLAKAEKRNSQDYYSELKFKSGISWSVVATDNISFRYETNNLIEHVGMATFPKDESIPFVLGLLNSKVVASILTFLSPTIVINAGEVDKIPVLQPEVVIKQKIIDISRDSISLSRNDWDTLETSWDFQRHPLLPQLPLGSETTFIDSMGKLGSFTVNSFLLADSFNVWNQECSQRFSRLKANEEELNRVFIDIYGLQDELTPDVDDKDVTVRKADLGRDIRSLISYAVGCMLGRYSLDKPSLAFAGGTWDESQYVTYHADHDGILPITDDEYFEDDIVGMFIDWVRTVYGAETLEANLKFIADALGGKGNPRDVIRQYFLNDFYKDHLKIYQKRPIYWLFDSGKKNGFKCLIYMHRYQPDTIARIRTDYLHETQARYRNAIETLERQSANASTGERVKMTKRLNALKAQAEEARVYEEKIHHLADQMIKIDLDDGVKVNYAKFADVLAPIK